MAKKQRPPTQEENDKFETEEALIGGELGTEEPEHINIAREVDGMIKLFGFDEGAAHAKFRAESAFHEEDADDWNEVARIVLERKTKHDKSTG